LILVSCAIANSRIPEVRAIRRRNRRGIRCDTMIMSAAVGVEQGPRVEGDLDGVALPSLLR